MQQPTHRQYTTTKRTRQKRFRRLAIAGCAGLLAAVLLVFGSGLIPSSNTALPAVQAHLTGARHLYGVADQPRLQLQLKASRPVTWFWTPPVYAAALPRVQVDYDGHRTDIPADVRPDSGGFAVTLQNQSTNKGQIRAGKYTVHVNGITDGGQKYTASYDFAWGVMALNTDQAVYTVGQTAHIQLGVVDAKGNTLCAAPLEVRIAPPGGAAAVVPYHNSTSCHGDSFSNEPDYSIDYPVQAAGTYTITAGIKDTPYTIDSTFVVVTAAQPVMLQRASISRFNPSHGYGMHMDIDLTQPFRGTVREVLPDTAFKITDGQGATVTTKDDKVTLAWQVDWPAGHHELAYSFNPPIQSPAFYELAPLTLTDAGGAQVYREAHGWQYVGDAAITFIKQTVVNVSTAAASNTSAVTSTAGNTLIIMATSGGTGSGTGLSAVTDTASNTWTVPPTGANQNPPANSATGVTGNTAMGYVANASAITSVTVTMRDGTAHLFTYNILEFSNIDTASPVSQSASNNNTTAPSSATTPTVTVATCDSPTTDQLLRGGNYFCGTADTQLIIAYMGAGGNTPVLTTSGFTATATTMTYGSGLIPAGAYMVTSASGTYSVTWTYSAAKNNSTCIMAFQQKANGSGEHSYFWSS